MEFYLLVAYKHFTSNKAALIIKKLTRVGNPRVTGITSQVVGGAPLVWMTKVEGSNSKFLVGDTHNIAFIDKGFNKPSSVLKAPIKAKQKLVAVFSYGEYLVFCLIHQVLVLKKVKIENTTLLKCGSIHSS